MFGAFIAYQLYRYSFTHEIGTDPAQHLRSLRDRARGPRIPAVAKAPSDPLRRDSPNAAAHPRRRSPRSLKGSIVALGNFDGFHLGHQAVVSRAIARAFHERRPVIVATFDPHPVKFFKPDVPPFRLTTLDQRERCSPMPARTRCWCSSSAPSSPRWMPRSSSPRCSRSGSAPRGWSPATISASARAARGDVALLREGRRRAWHRRRSGRAGRPRRRAHFVGPDPRGAGRGRHRHGDAHAEPRLCDRGRGPARRRARARARLSDREPGARRLSAAEIRHLCGARDAGGRSEHPGVASLGVRPTFEPPQELLEAHLFGFDGDLYGRKIEVALHAYIREERKFDGVEALVAEMRRTRRRRGGCCALTSP